MKTKNTNSDLKNRTAQLIEDKTEALKIDFAKQVPLMGFSGGVNATISKMPVFRLNTVAAFTDGLQRLALQFPECAPHVPFFVPLFKRLENLTASQRDEFLVSFLGSARVTARSDDDKSLVVAIFS